MKVLSLALAALLGLSADAKQISGRELNQRMANGQVNRSTLMRGAKPYGATARKLDEQAEQWELTGTHSIQFDSCFSLTIQDNDMLNDENLLAYAKNGDIIAEKSYILFNVCETQYCYYQSDNEKMQFIVDTATFVQALADFIPNQQEQYCQACEENVDYCMPEDDADQQGQDAQQQEGDQEQEGQQEGQAEEEDNGAERFLAQNRVVEYIDCNKCAELGCYDEEEDQQQNQGEGYYNENPTFEEALQWLEGVSTCNQIEDQYWNGQNIYSGLICNAKGNGVEIAVFADENCNAYIPSESYGSRMSYEEQLYYSKSESLVRYIFQEDFDCYNPEIEYTNPWAEAQNDQQEEQQEEDNGEAPEAGDWCQALFEGDFQATNLYDCDGYEADNDQEAEEAEENAYEWYNYQLSEQDLENEQTVCLVVKALEGGRPTLYNQKQGGTLFDYNKRASGNDKKGLSGGAIFGIIVVVLGVVGAGAYFAVQKKGSVNSKKAPLINGSMA
jgi:hypothetical protein